MISQKLLEESFSESHSVADIVEGTILKKEQDVLQQIPKRQIFRQLEHRINIQELKRLIKRI